MAVAVTFRAFAIRDSKKEKGREFTLSSFMGLVRGMGVR